MILGFFFFFFFFERPILFFCGFVILSSEVERVGWGWWFLAMSWHGGKVKSHRCVMCQCLLLVLFGPLVLFKAWLLKVFSKYCPHGLDYAGGESISLLQGILPYSSPSPLTCTRICLEVALGFSFSFFRHQWQTPSKKYNAMFLDHDWSSRGWFGALEPL